MRKKNSTLFYHDFSLRAGPLLYRYVLIVLCLCSFGFELMAQTEKRIFTVGNSVTDGVNFEGFKELAESRGYIHTLGRHMIPGAPLSWLWDNQNSGFVTEPYGAPNNAFPNYTWDAISLQPFDRMIEGPDGDRAVAKKYIDLARGKSPDVQFYIYSRYPRDPRKEGDTSPLTADIWNNLWLRTFTGGYDGSNESRDFFEKLITGLRSDYAGTSLKQPLMIPLGEVMYTLNNKMKGGQVSGYSSIWQLYADGIHVTKEGSYMVACTFFATIYKESPVGLPVPSQYGTISDHLKNVIQQTVWEVVTGNTSWTGVSGGNVAVTGVAVSPTSLSLAVNQTGQLNATISPSNASNKNVSWSSSNTNVATVSATGLVTGKATGSATITVTTQDGSRTATASVSVTNNSVPVTGVTVSPANVVVNTGNTVTLTATVSPADATNKNIIWSSNNTAAATVSAAGVVTGVAAGYATIFARTQDGGKEAVSQVQVTANSKPVASISATPTSGSAPLAVQFSASNSTDPNPGDYILGFDWDFGDGSPRANSNAPSHTYTTAGTYTVTLRVMDNHDLYSDPVSTTITVNGGGSGTVVREVWSNITGTTVSAIPVTTNPTSTSNLTSLEAPTDVADNYGVRIRGYITPATTGTYKFYIAADDNAEFWLNTNGTATRRAYVEGWTSPKQWDKNPATQHSADIALTAGTRYYFEILHKEGGGGDNLAVGWTGPGISAITVVPGSVLSPWNSTDSNLRNADNPSSTVVGLDYSYYEGNWSTLPNFDALTAAKQGNVTNFDLTPRNRNDNFGFKFTGFVDVPSDGTYTFFTSSDDGSKLYIGSTEVVNNDGLHGTVEKSGTIGLKKGKHAITVTYFEATGGETLTVSYSGPGVSKQTIPASALSRSSTTNGFSGTYKITARHSSKALDVNGGSTADGANVQQWTANGTAAQQWVITATTDGHYKLENKGSNKALEVSNNGTTDGANVQQWSYVGSNSQQWKIEATTDGFYRLLNRHSGKALDVNGGTGATADGVNVHQWSYGGAYNQQWKLEQLSTATARLATTEGEQSAEMSSEKAFSEGLLLYPNPVTGGSITLELGAKEAGKATVTLTTVLGQRTLLQEVLLEKGQNTLQLSTSGMASGLYILTVKQGSRQAMQKLFIQ